MNEPKAKLMMARQFAHKLYDYELRDFDPGDKTEFDLCWVEEKIGNPYTGYWWRGSWVFGMGLIDVYFPCATTRPCTEEERELWTRGRVGSTFAPSYKLEPAWFA